MSKQGLIISVIRRYEKQKVPWNNFDKEIIVLFQIQNNMVQAEFKCS